MIANLLELTIKITIILIPIRKKYHSLLKLDIYIYILLNSPLYEYFTY